MEMENPSDMEISCSSSSVSQEPETAKSAPVENEAPPTKKSLSFILAFASLMASNFISIMDTVIVATALPAIAHDLNAHSNAAYWIGSGFLFAQAVSQPLYGTLSIVFGRKACLVFAMAVFTLASLFCAVAQSVGWLIVARVVCTTPHTRLELRNITWKCPFAN
jgi:predicted MFS family arabinose efflux permease